MHSVPPHFLSGGKLGRQLCCSVVPGTAGCRHPLPNSTNCPWSFQGPYQKGLRSDKFAAGQVDRRSRTCSLTSHCEWGERANRCRPSRFLFQEAFQGKSRQDGKDHGALEGLNFWVLAATGSPSQPEGSWVSGLTLVYLEQDSGTAGGVVLVRLNPPRSYWPGDGHFTAISSTRVILWPAGPHRHVFPSSAGQIRHVFNADSAVHVLSVRLKKTLREPKGALEGWHTSRQMWDPVLSFFE
jgi:hypothetical protein